MPDAPPDLFTRIPPELFRPLSDKLAPVHWRVLAAFYAYEFDGEASDLGRDTAVGIAEEVLRGSPIWDERREEILRDTESVDGDTTVAALDEEAAVLRRAALYVLSRLEWAGWFQFEYRRSVGAALSFPPYAVWILEALLRVARDEQPELLGYAHTIATTLEPEAFTAHPGLALSEARRHAADFVRALKVLNRNIQGSTQRLLNEVASAPDLLRESLEAYQTRVMGNYHRIKTVDNFYKWRDAIARRLDLIAGNDATLDDAAEWYAAHQGITARSAREQADSALRALRRQIDLLPGILNQIDEKNARFSGVALRKLLYLLRQDQRTEGQLQFLVERLARDEAPGLEFDLYRCELLSDGFLYTPRTRRPPTPPQRIEPPDPDADLNAVREAVARGLMHPYLRRKVDAFVSDFLGGRRERSVAELKVEGDGDYVRVLYIVAYGLDGRSRFRFERVLCSEQQCTGWDCTGCRVHQGPYSFPRGVVVAAPSSIGAGEARA